MYGTLKLNYRTPRQIGRTVEHWLILGLQYRGNLKKSIPNMPLSLLRCQRTLVVSAFSLLTHIKKLAHAKKQKRHKKRLFISVY